jgi:hypothetical protein
MIRDVEYCRVHVIICESFVSWKVFFDLIGSWPNAEQFFFEEAKLIH